MLTEAIEIYRSARLSDCEERAFMLTAVDVPNETTREGENFLLWVESSRVEEARAHLQRYQAESGPAPPPPAVPVHHPRAWVGCILYAATLVGVAYAIGAGLGRLDAFDTGELDSARVQQGQWWRAWTALTLHLDLEHLVANLGAGIWFGYLAGRRLGAGTAWALIVTGAATANLSEALIGSPLHRAVGASTAVFTALGLLSAYAWRERRRTYEHWARRWGPLIAGVILLGWTGSAGERTDLIAHLAGFAIGALIGALAAGPLARRLLGRVPQSLAGLFALGSIIIAWGFALSS